MKKLRLISKFMTSQAGKQITTIHILSNISRRKANQVMKIGQLIKKTCEILSFKNHAENEAVRLVQDLFLLFKKALHNVKTSRQHLSFNIFW